MHRLEHVALHEQRLIAVREREQPNTQAHAELEDARDRRTRIERETKAAGAHAWIAIGGDNRTPPARRQPRVRMEKQKPAPVRHRRAGIHLPGSSPWCLDPDDVRAREAKRRQRTGVLARRDDDHFCAAAVEHAQRASERLAVAVNRNDDGS